MTSDTELTRLLKQSIAMTKSKPVTSRITFMDGSKSEFSKEEAERHHQDTLERLQSFNDTHDILEFGSDQRREWLFLAFQELVRDSWPFMRAISNQVEGVRKEVCEEWLAVHARIMRRGAAE